MTQIAKTPAPPYYAVIFTSIRNDKENQGYNQMAQAMSALVEQQPGFLGVESARNSDGLGITVSYWDSLDAITSWRDHSAHQVAQEKGREIWYGAYTARICKVEREYSL